ncbi:MAG TPA: aminopeptidase [Nitrososphaeria archaeon]|nr:aminopeptidase [Nitrososphaeria archaeon]
MADPRVSRLAKLISEYSVSIKPGDEVVIRAGVDALPLVRELVKVVVEMGGYPHVLLSDSSIEEIFYRHADEKVLKHLSPIEKLIQERVDVLISIISHSHAKPLIGVDPEKIRIRRAARAELTEIFMRRQASGELRWNLSIYPTNALAQEAGMGPMEYEDFIFHACMVDRPDPVAAWREQAEAQRHVADLLGKIDELKIVSEDTDLLIKVGGRRWINDDGHHNMPAGEVFTAPVEDGVEGRVRFSFPAVWGGFEVEGVRLSFRRGKVVEASAEKGEEKLKKILETDEGAKRLGEVAFGLNYNITRHTKQILTDEKIGGTMHLALGAAYPETGGVNKSAIHWDLIVDMKRGKVYGDGDLIYENGKFIT